MSCYARRLSVRKHYLSDKDLNAMSQATLTISSKNYSSWSLRGWLLCRMAGLDFAEVLVELK